MQGFKGSLALKSKYPKLGALDTLRPYCLGTWMLRSGFRISSVMCSKAFWSGSSVHAVTSYIGPKREKGLNNDPAACLPSVMAFLGVPAE